MLKTAQSLLENGQRSAALLCLKSVNTHEQLEARLLTASCLGPQESLQLLQHTIAEQGDTMSFELGARVLQRVITLHLECGHKASLALTLASDALAAAQVYCFAFGSCLFWQCVLIQITLSQLGTHAKPASGYVSLFKKATTLAAKLKITSLKFFLETLLLHYMCHFGLFEKALKFMSDFPQMQSDGTEELSSYRNLIETIVYMSLGRRGHAIASFGKVSRNLLVKDDLLKFDFAISKGLEIHWTVGRDLRDACDSICAVIDLGSGLQTCTPTVDSPILVKVTQILTLASQNQPAQQLLDETISELTRKQYDMHLDMLLLVQACVFQSEKKLAQARQIYAGFSNRSKNRNLSLFCNVHLALMSLSEDDDEALNLLVQKVKDAADSSCHLPGYAQVIELLEALCALKKREYQNSKKHLASVLKSFVSSDNVNLGYVAVELKIVCFIGLGQIYCLTCTDQAKSMLNTALGFCRSMKSKVLTNLCETLLEDVKKSEQVSSQ